MSAPLDEDAELRSVALQNAQSIRAARQRAEDDLRRTQDALRESRERLTAALAAADTGTFRWNIRTGALDADENLDRLFGLPSGRSLRSLDELVAAVYADDRGRVDEAFENARLGEDLDLEFRVCWPDGDLHWISERGKTTRDASGRPVYVTGACVDFTRRRVAQENLRTSEEQLRCITDAAPALISYVDAGERFRFMNLQYETWFGTPRERMLGLPVRDVLGEPSYAAVRPYVERVLSGESVRFETQVFTGDDRERFVEASYIPDVAGDGSVRGYYALVNDITARRRTAEALREESRVLELLNDTGTAIAAELDLPALAQAVTDSATALSGARFGAFSYSVRGESGELVLLRALSGAVPDAPERLGSRGDAPLFGPGFDDPNVFRSADVTREPGFRAGAGGSGEPETKPPVRSYLSVPVKSRSGEVIGRLFFGHPEPDVFTERAERLVGGMAAQAGIAIDNARLYEAARQATEERSRLLESERSARTAAERMSEMKDEFLATLSHELRTPLNAIVGWAHLLRRGPKDHADLLKGLDTIERNARMQAQLIEDLLDMSRITSGKIRLDVREIQPAAFIDAAVETLQHAADAKGVAIARFLDPSAGPISGDPGRLQQVVWNLLSNAIKFTPRGGRIQILLERVSSHVELAVADTGIGIRPEFIAHLFERFRQADASTTRRYGGLGLGLSIVKHLVEAHGGTVRVSSAGEGQGTTVAVSLPLMAVHRSSAEERLHPKAAGLLPAGFPATDLSGVRILVVDDQSDARDLVQRVLEDCGANVLTAGSADEAVELAESQKPHVLVSDIGMPGADGYELLKRIRRLGPARGGKVPAIALTAFARSEDRTRALRTGFLVHVAKPVDPAELVATVASVAGRVEG